MAALQLDSQSVQPIDRLVVVFERPCLTQPTFDCCPVALGQMFEHIPFLVPDTALHGCFAEHVPDRLVERFRPVDHEQHPLLGIEPTLDEIGQQGGRDGRVLCRALPEPEWHLHPVGRDPEADDVRSPPQLDPVQHQHRQANVVEAAGHQLATGVDFCVYGAPMLECRVMRGRPLATAATSSR